MVVEELVEGLSEGLDGSRLGKFDHLLIEEDELKNGYKYINGSSKLVQHLGAHIDQLVRVISGDLSN